ncbi:uncharacterized protein PGTG_11263 [Puccinia graminis f. sp. tritici CRL 75-36-700-3]|uniref:Uncharacterized protein n=1 Tax=Puccinia graminis f. sp. tritici (strain CRL 75-36-700-3 / race SCCL) TaxID=418459 RepID=E3KLB9_PUCGT|nr:uncharacterized protein PGTG_11263 [Puccinia graminis f. sp. tritici CRL 75-36-700-3]EFP85094.1 hypothetical protein PGTG_11263 [Puccinia graminis f. sp. tritici CRL 75-36-700-3]
MTNPSASTSSSTHSTTTTTATHIVNEDDGAGLVYWEDHQQQNKKLIEQVKSPESNSNSSQTNKRNSTLAGIPSPSKPTTTSARTELLQPTHQNNQKALRQTKRRKNRAALTHSDHEPQKITKPSTKPPLLPKQMAWQELASRLKRRELDSISETPQTRSTTNQSLSKIDSLPKRVFPSSSSLIAPNLENRSHQPTLPQTSSTKPALKSILRSSSNATHQKAPLQNNPNPKSTVTIVSKDSPSCQDDSSGLTNQPQMRNQSTKPCEPTREVPGCVSKQKPSVPAGISPKKSIPADSKMHAAQSGGGGCEPWELEEDDDEFGSQLLELADLVEKEQKMSQEIALPSDRNRERSTTRLSSSKTCIAPHSNTTTPPWKTVDNSRKRAPASIRGAALPPAPTTNINQLLPPKSNIITNQQQQQQNDRTVKRAQPVVLKQKSPIIYKTAMVSKASMPPTSVHPNPVEGRRKNLGVVGTPKQVGPKPADQGLSINNNRPSSLHNPAQKLTYSDALIRPRRLQLPLDPTHSALRIRPLLHNPSPPTLIHHPLPPLAKKSAVSSSSSHATATAVDKTLDLESLFCGIQGDDLDWDPNDQ